MDELARTSGDLADQPASTRDVTLRSGSAGTCEYCGSPLVAGYYFCLNCATPHKTVESVLPAVYVAPPTEGELIKRKAPHAWPLFWSYLGVVLGSFILSALLFGPEEMVYAIALGSVAIFVTTAVFGAIHWQSLAVQFRKIGFLHPAAWIGLAVLVPLLAINYGYHELFLRSLADGPVDTIEKLRETIGDGGMVLFMCILPAIMEEIAFRGLLQHWLQVAIKPMRAVIIASALFTALHFSVVSAPYLFAVGMLLGMVKLKTGSLYPSMLIHFLHNFAVLELFRLL